MRTNAETNSLLFRTIEETRELGKHLQAAIKKSVHAE